MAVQAAALKPRRSAGGCAASTGTAGAAGPPQASHAVQAVRVALHRMGQRVEPERVKAKPYGRAARGLDPNTT